MFREEATWAFFLSQKAPSPVEGRVPSPWSPVGAGGCTAWLLLGSPCGEVGREGPAPTPFCLISCQSPS